MTDRVTLKLWLHREEGDAWVCSASGIGAGTFLPKSEIAIEEGHPVPTMLPVGPVRVELPRWLARDRGLVDTPAEGQGSLFDA